MKVSTHGDSAEVNRTNTKKNQISEMLSTTVAVACILSVGVSIANAEDNITLPPVEVETTEEQDADAARKKVIAAEVQRRRRAEITQQAKRNRRAAAAAAQAKRNRRAAAIRAAQRKRAAAANARAAVEAQARAEEEARIAAAEAVAKAKEVARGNPHADPDAHFKSDTLANSRLPGKVVDTPRTVTTVGKELLEKTSTTSVREIARTTPGVSLGFGEGGNQYGDNIYIRGFKANNDIYVDGVRDTGISVRDSFNTEQVEVVKGPAGTVGGRGTTGGALDIVTKKAKDVSFYEVNAEITSVGTKRVTTDLNHTFNENLQFRFNGLFQDGMTPGRDGVEDDRKGAGLAATLKMTDQLKFEVDYSYLDLSQTPDWGVPWFTEISAPVTEYNGVDRSTFYGLAGRDFQDVTRHVGTMKVTYDISEDAKITNTTRVTKITNDYFLTTPESGVWNEPDDAISARHGRVSDPTIDPNDPSTWKTAVGYKSVSAETKVFSNVLETSGKFDEGRFGHTYVVGAGITKEKVQNYGAYSAAVSSCIVSAFNPDQLASGCGSALTAPGGTPTLTEVSTYSIYALDTVKLSEKWLINGGIRADFYDIERSGLDRSQVAYSLARKDTLVNWNAGITYKPVKHLSLYAAVASSMNPSGQEVAAGGGFYGGLDSNNQLFGPEKNLSLEAGVKYEFNDHLLMTAALFQTTKSGALESQGRGPTAVTTAGLEYRNRGLELGIAGNVTDRFSVHGGAVFMKSEILKSATASNVGLRVSNIPHQQFNLLGTYEVNEKLTVGARVNYASDLFLGSTAENGKELPTNKTFDLLATYKFNDKISLQFNANNITDAATYDAGYRSGTPYVLVGPGRELSLSFKAKF